MLDIASLVVRCEASEVTDMTFDPETLKRRLERDLEIIRRYEELVARHGGKAPGPEPTPGPGGKLSLAAITEQALDDEWRDVGYYHDKVRANGWPKSARSAVATALRRLVDNKGIAEKKGEKGERITFRRKQPA